MLETFSAMAVPIESLFDPLGNPIRFPYQVLESNTFQVVKLNGHPSHRRPSWEFILKALEENPTKVQDATEAIEKTMKEGGFSDAKAEMKEKCFLPHSKILCIKYTLEGIKLMNSVLFIPFCRRRGVGPHEQRSAGARLGSCAGAGKRPN